MSQTNQETAAELRAMAEHDRKYLLNVADGPECIRIWTSEEDAIVDWSPDIPALYVDLAVNGAYSRVGPFTLKSIRQGVEKALGVADKLDPLAAKPEPRMMQANPSCHGGRHGERHAADYACSEDPPCISEPKEASPSVFDPERMASNSRAVDAMPPWVKGSPVNKREASPSVDTPKCANCNDTGKVTQRFKMDSQDVAESILNCGLCEKGTGKAPSPEPVKPRRWIVSEANLYPSSLILNGKSISVKVLDLPAVETSPFETIESYFVRQSEWSERTFGSGTRTQGIADHIRKELNEMLANPHDLEEWVDLIMLSMDGFWRHGGDPRQILAHLNAKQKKNFERKWSKPEEGKAVEHIRETSPEVSDAELYRLYEIGHAAWLKTANSLLDSRCEFMRAVLREARVGRKITAADWGKAKYAFIACSGDWEMSLRGAFEAIGFEVEGGA